MNKKHTMESRTLSKRDSRRCKTILPCFFLIYLYSDILPFRSTKRVQTRGWKTRKNAIFFTDAYEAKVYLLRVFFGI